MLEAAELFRLRTANERQAEWKKWGPYLSERQWGTVREDLSTSGEAWDYFTHDHARSRVYRGGEDGIAGVSDEDQQLCLAIAMWNGSDPIIKERLFGLSNREGNHGEDVKEYYFYLDNTPTHSYMKYLYKYPQRAFPYEHLVRTNERRTRNEPEYELLDTGIFDDDRYFDVFVEYAKAGAEDILIKITIHNRGPESAPFDLLPTLWFRNTWSWSADSARPSLIEFSDMIHGIAASHWNLGEYFLFCEKYPRLLFTENESNTERLFQIPNRTPYVKDAFHNYLIHRAANSVNPTQAGTKACALYRMIVKPNDAATVRLRLTQFDVSNLPHSGFEPFGRDFEATFMKRIREADEFYNSLLPTKIDKEERRVARQAIAALLWNKQYYYFDVHKWVTDHHADSQAAMSRLAGYDDWSYMLNGAIISPPDKWEYPWYSSWHLPFHAVAFGPVDQQFAKDQLELLLQALYQNPTGQIPASEANFGEVTPPVYAWAALYLYNTERFNSDHRDTAFLKRVFLKLLTNFTWWVNRRDRFGKNIFEGGFVGLDTIGPFDPGKPLPTGGFIEKADGIAWAALFCQNMLEIAIELSADDPSYEEMVVKFYEHVMWIALSLNRTDPEGFWDEEDGFYYDRIRLPNGTSVKLNVRSLVGLLPLCAITAIEKYQWDQNPRLTLHLQRRLRQLPQLAAAMHPLGESGIAGRKLISLLSSERLRRILGKLFDENEFLSSYGIRSLSHYHAEHPYIFSQHGDEYRVSYLAGESDSPMFGGNTNWRGPIWFPMNVMIIRALLTLYAYYGDTFPVEYPTGSGNLLNLFDVSRDLVRRLTRVFLPNQNQARPIYGSAGKFQSDPQWRDYITFFEYFNGDTGAGLGASHLTGWTALIGGLIHIFNQLDAANLLESGREAAFRSSLRKIV